MDVASEQTEHLHPDTAKLVFADASTRIESIRQRRWIAHEPACRVLASLEGILDQPVSDRMEGLLLTAPSGMGKTMLLKGFRRKHSTTEPNPEGVRESPVVLALMPEMPTERAILVQLLKAIEAPTKSVYTQTILQLRETVFRLLREIRAKVIAIDEINSLLVGSAKQQRAILQLLRFMSNEIQVAVVCAGIPESRHALFSDPQLAARLGDYQFPAWERSQDFQEFINLTVQTFPLRKPSLVVSSRVQYLLLERSNGVTSAICRALQRAALLAIQGGEERITYDSLGAQVVWSGMKPTLVTPRRVRVVNSLRADG